MRSFRGWGRALCAAVPLAAGACMPRAGEAPLTVSPPPPLTAPRVAPVAPAVPGERAVLPPDPSTLRPWDALLASPWAADSLLIEDRDRWIDIWSGPRGASLTASLERLQAYQPLVDGALLRHHLPPSLRYLPLVESDYTPGAASPASAVGLWQLMAGTARAHGLRVGALVDERRDPVRSTEAAATFLEELHEHFGSWLLTLAAYNGGPNRVDRLLADYAGGAEPCDSLFFVIRPHLPRETRQFVPRFLAAVRLGEDPEAYGVRPPAPAAPFDYEDVRVPDATTLDVVASAAGTDEAAVLRLNPQLVKGVTPRGVPTVVRVPAGTGGRFQLAYAAVPPSQRVTVVEHEVGKGETLWGIARRFHVSLAALQAANPKVSPRRMRPGVRLLVPTAPGAARLLAARTAAARSGRYVVGPGDSLREIARRHGVSEDDLARWNGLQREAVLEPGQALRVRASS